LIGQDLRFIQGEGTDSLKTAWEIRGYYFFEKNNNVVFLLLKNFSQKRPFF
jgi:hypothetical protein